MSDPIFCVPVGSVGVQVSPQLSIGFKRPHLPISHDSIRAYTLLDVYGLENAPVCNGKSENTNIQPHRTVRATRSNSTQKTALGRRRVSVQAVSKLFCDMFLWHNYIDLRDTHPEPQPFIPQERDLSLYNLFNHLIFIVLLKGLWICHVCNTDVKFGTVVTTSNIFQ